LHDFSQRLRSVDTRGVSVRGNLFGSYFSAARNDRKPRLAWLIGLQVFRVGSGDFSGPGYRAGFVPVQMTLEGRNWDVLTGLTALPMAWSGEKNKRRSG